jgi:hypothetical protein
MVYFQKWIICKAIEIRRIVENEFVKYHNTFYDEEKGGFDFYIFV